MAQVQTSPSARVRAQLEHPVVDSDGHYVEITPILEDYIKEAGGADTVQRLNSRRSRAGDWYRMSLKERRDNWTSAPAWWFVTQEATDRATASLPKLLHDRMDELGMDYTVLFPSNTMGFMSEQDDEIRGVLCRAMNTYLRDMFAEFSDRMTPVALIPMVRPQDALVELEYAVKELGLKAVVLSSYAHRPVTWVNQEMANDPYSQRLDFFGIDSEDMETAAVHQVAHISGVPFLAVRIISNSEYHDQEFRPELGSDCAEFVIDVVKALAN